MDAVRNTVTNSITMPAGEYWVGDPCYAVPDDEWIPWLQAADYENERRYLVANITGRPVLGISTAYGDGCYRDTEGNEYPVDAGLIGCVPVQRAIANPTGMHRVIFNEPFNCSWSEHEGLITIGGIEIRTDYDDEDFDC